jgi:hypothetical protein
VDNERGLFQLNQRQRKYTNCSKKQRFEVQIQPSGHLRQSGNFSQYLILGEVLYRYCACRADDSASPTTFA